MLKRWMVGPLALAALVVALHGVARAGTRLPGSTLGPDPFYLIFDEWGNGKIAHNGGPFTTQDGIVGADPSGGLSGNVLYWVLPEIVAEGDQVFYEPNGVGANGAPEISDILRFVTVSTATANVSYMIFYSDLPERGEVPPPADTGFPGQLINPQSNKEVIVGGIEYLPLDFGYPNDNRYLGISDTPEPATFVTAGLGILAAAGYGVYRKKRA